MAVSHQVPDNLMTTLLVSNKMSLSFSRRTPVPGHGKAVGRDGEALFSTRLPQCFKALVQGHNPGLKREDKMTPKFGA